MLTMRRFFWLVPAVIIALILTNCVLPDETTPLPPATKPPHPTPDPGYELAGYRRISEGEVTDHWGEQVPSKEGYDWSEAAFTTGEGEFSVDELVTYLYEPIGITSATPLSFACPEPKEGFQLVGLTRCKDFEVVEHWGKSGPSRGGHISINSRTEVEDGALVLDEIILCVYDPVPPVSEELQVMLYDCPPPESGYKLVGFTYVKNFVVQNYWGKGEASKEGYLYVKSRTVMRGGVFEADEIWACVYEPYEEAEKVVFTDPNLETVIREVTGIDVGPIYAWGLQHLTYLDASAFEITDITGLEHCINLTSLDLSWNLITDISPLAGLTSLTSLHLGSNQITDISPLVSLVNLTQLWLDDNEISDISPLLQNEGLGTGVVISVWANPLSLASIKTYMPQLKERGVTVDYHATVCLPAAKTVWDGAFPVSRTDEIMVFPGESVHFRLEVENDGGTDLALLRIADFLPIGLEYIAESAILWYEGKGTPSLPGPWMGWRTEPQIILQETGAELFWNLAETDLPELGPGDRMGIDYEVIAVEPGSYIDEFSFFGHCAVDPSRVVFGGDAATVTVAWTTD